METEIARESDARRDFKTGRGGLLDIETAVQYLQLEHAHQHPDLVEVRTVAEEIHLLTEKGILAASDAQCLAEGWEFLQHLSSRLRIVENRSISDLDVERGDLDEVARRLGYTATGRASGARRALLDEYHRRTSDIRTGYERILAVSGSTPATELKSAPDPASGTKPGRRLRNRTALSSVRKRSGRQHRR